MVVEGTELQPKMYRMTVTGKEGKSVQFNITPEQKVAALGTEAFEKSPNARAAQPYIEALNKMGGFSTAIHPGESSRSNAFLDKTDFPSIQHYGINANLEQPSKGLFLLRLSIFDPVTKSWHDSIPSPLMTEDGIIPAMRGLNDAALYEMINGAPATANDIKAVEIASKKPL